MPRRRKTINDEKKCVQCGVVKIGSDFPYRGKSKVTGEPCLSSTCRECNKAYLRQYYRTNVDKAKAYAKERRAKDIDTHRRNARQHQILRKYGLTPEAYEVMVAAQGGGCAICGGTGGMHHMVSPLVIDHCHDTNEVRGLLCAGCNAGLGQFGDSPERLIAAAAYLISRLDILAEAGEPNFV